MEERFLVIKKLWRENLGRSNRGGERRLSKKQNRSAEGPSARRINAISAGMKSCKTYLEVGVAQGLTFEQVRVEQRWAVDPNPQFDQIELPKGVVFKRLESDSFFEQIEPEQKFDVVFLDGLHTWQQTYKDLMNTLGHSYPHTIVVIDDVVPDDALAAIPDWDEALRRKDAAGITDGRWQGDVFKVLLIVQDHHPELEFCVVGKSEVGDNPQAIVWKRDSGGVTLDARKLAHLEDSYAAIEYDKIFVNGEIPENFRHVDEKEGIALALKMTQK
jgi:hypothetical protein